MTKIKVLTLQQKEQDLSLIGFNCKSFGLFNRYENVFCDDKEDICVQITVFYDETVLESFDEKIDIFLLTYYLGDKESFKLFKERHTFLSTLSSTTPFLALGIAKEGNEPDIKLMENNRDECLHEGNGNDFIEFFAVAENNVSQTILDFMSDFDQKKLAHIEKYLNITPFASPSKLFWVFDSEAHHSLFFLFKGTIYSLEGKDLLAQSEPLLLSNCNKAIDSSTLSKAIMSEKEELLLERMRAQSSGIQNVLQVKDNLILFFRGEVIVYHCPTNRFDVVAKNAYYPLISPDAIYASYVRDGDIYISNIVNRDSKEIRLTFENEDNSDLKSAGESKFIIQEEFDRFDSYWWSPTFKSSEIVDERVYEILYIGEDESMVYEYGIPQPGTTEGIDQYRYPLVGTANTLMTAVIVSLKINIKTNKYSIAKTIFFTTGKDQKIDVNLSNDYSWVEYISHAGWTLDGNAYLEVLDRLQERIAYLFYDSSKREVRTVFEAKLPIANVSPHIHALSNNRLLISSEHLNGYRNLYVIQENQDPILVSKFSTDLIVSSLEIVVNDNRVYFAASRVDNPLTRLVYCSQLPLPNQKDFLPFTECLNLRENVPFDCFVSSFSVNPSDSVLIMFASDAKSVSTTSQSKHWINQCKVDVFDRSFIINLKNNTSQRIAFYKQLTHPSIIVPEFFSFVPDKTLFTLHGTVFLPKTKPPKNGFPVLLSIYGGPHVQLVAKKQNSVLDPKRQMYSHNGFAVVTIDNRGSDGRGLAFEKDLKYKMGQIEVDDFLSGLDYLHSKGYPIDLKRVVISGWSYGGYISLIAIGQRKDRFKAAICGSPVVEWEGYDTGYTERYMGLPEQQMDAYRKGNVLTYVPSFPNFGQRVMIIHGTKDENVHFSHSTTLVSALQQHNKPYRFVLLTSRHGVSQWSDHVILERTILDFVLSGITE